MVETNTNGKHHVVIFFCPLIKSSCPSKGTAFYTRRLLNKQVCLTSRGLDGAWFGPGRLLLVAARRPVWPHKRPFVPSAEGLIDGSAGRGPGASGPTAGCRTGSCTRTRASPAASKNTSAVHITKDLRFHSIRGTFLSGISVMFFSTSLETIITYLIVREATVRGRHETGWRSLLRASEATK